MVRHSPHQNHTLINSTITNQEIDEFDRLRKANQLYRQVN